jgi:hypothetical protein
VVIKISSSKIQQKFFKTYTREDFYSFSNELSKIVISFSDFMAHKKKKPECEKDEKFIEILKKELL